MTTGTAREFHVRRGECESVRAAYQLFVETLGPDAVEDYDSFRLTVSPDAKKALSPKLMEAYVGGRLAGAMLGVYLRRVNGGMILYAGVREPFRRQGMYTHMRGCLLAELDAESEGGLGFLLSEIEDGHVLYRKYLDDWGAFVATPRYFQPAVQGLSRRRLNLIVAPQAADRAETVEALPAIVREVFATVYRIEDPGSHADLRGAMDSITAS